MDVLYVLIQRLGPKRNGMSWMTYQVRVQPHGWPRQHCPQQRIQKPPHYHPNQFDLDKS